MKDKVSKIIIVSYGDRLNKISPSPPTSFSSLKIPDPHFTTFNGQLYSCHGECDLVLMHSQVVEYNPSGM